MPLATNEQIKEQLTELVLCFNTTIPPRQHLLTLTHSDTGSTLSYREVRILHQLNFVDPTGWPGAYPIDNINRYTTLTGRGKEDLSEDLLYHWMTNFKYLKTETQLKEAIQTPETGGSIATTIALNRYLQTHPLGDILKGSKFRWVKHPTGDYVQQTLYKNNTNHLRALDFTNQNLAFFPSPNLGSLVTFNSWLHKKIESINTAKDNQPRSLLPHSAKATATFAFKSEPKKKNTANPLFLGIELELEGMTTSEYKTLDVLKQHAILKTDGSLDSGVEICSAPATIDIHKQEFEPFFNKLKENKSKLVAKNTCGIHIHIDKAHLSQLHIANIYLLVNKEENRKNLIKIAGRTPNQYCQPHDAGYAHFTQYGENSKYRMVNLRPTDTIELRIFASTTEFPTFCKYLEFAQALVDYTKPGFLNIPISKLPLWENFKNYVKTQPKQYPTLGKEMADGF